MLAQEVLHDCEVAQRIKDVMTEGDLDFVFLILGHPTMRPDTGFVELVSSFWFSLLPTLRPHYLILGTRIYRGTFFFRDSIAP